MSRKRKPVLQLGAASSKLHKYGYSKEFHSSDKKGKGSLPALVGNYSDSDSDDSSNEQEEHSAYVPATEPVPVLAETSAIQPMKIGNGDTVTGDHDKSPDMDNELKNFLSEIEAIPVPTDGAGDQDQNLISSEPNYLSSLSKETVAESVPNNGNGLSEDSSIQQDVDSSSTKPKPQYSMFVKGASEFVHSPSSQEVETSAAKGGEAEKKPEEDIPEEPTSCWQLVQDEGSQYYYYWNTLTNEVTWEIPSEYTQFLLLHREFTEKLARLPPNVLKAYEDRKAKEAELLASASVQPSTEASNDTQTKQTMYGPVDHSSPAPASSTAEHTSSLTHRAQRKHKKEKKKKRHKRRHSGSSSNSSDVEGSKEVSKTQVYGPQLPQENQAMASGPVSTGPESVSATSRSVAGSQLLSIVPYLSDADEDENAESENEAESKINNAPVPVEKKSIFKSQINSSDIEDALKHNSESGDAYKAEEINLHKDVTELNDFYEVTKEKAPSGEENSENSLKLDENNTGAEALKNSTKMEKLAQEVIDMFAEDTPNSQSPVGNQGSVKDDVKAGKETSIGKDKEAAQSSKSTSKVYASSHSKITTSSFNSSSSSLGSKVSTEVKKTKGKDIKDTVNLLNIVGYGSDEEEQNGVENIERKERHTEVKTKEETTKRSSSPSESKKRKKEKKRHRHDNKDRRENDDEKEDQFPPNILAGNLGKDVKARVEETLDKEISDIVIQSVSQISHSEMKETVSSNSDQTDVLPDQGPDEARDMKIKEGKLFKHPKTDREAEKSHKSKEEAEGVKKIKALKQATEEKIIMPEVEKVVMKKAESVKQEKEVNNDKDGKDDDDDDIDFEDLDDLDRALEVALEKKKVELAKYEEQERKQEKHLSEAQKSEDQSIEETSQLICDKVEPTVELEEKLKDEVKDAAELALSKLEFLDISTDSLSRLQILFIELQTRLLDWVAGGLSTIYFQEQLGVAQGLLEQYEQSAVPQGWACQWDRGNNRYCYRNLTTNRIQWDYPDDNPGKSNAEKSGSSAGNDSKSIASAGKNRKEDFEKNTSTSKHEKSHEKGSTGGGRGSEEDKDGLRKKGGSSNRHRKREERDKDRGSKHDKRRDGSSSSHRYRRKRRRRRDHSSSSDSSDDNGGGDITNISAGKSSSVTSSSSNRRHHRHHHKVSKKKKKRRSEQRSRSPSVEIVAASDDKIGSGKENGDDGKSTPSVMVVEASPVNSSTVSTPYMDVDTEAASNKSMPQSGEGTTRDFINGEPLVKTFKEDKVVGDEDGDVDGVSFDLEEGKVQEDGEIQEEGGAKSDGDDEEVDRKKVEGEAANPAVIYKPPQIVVPPQIVAAARQPDLYGVQQPVTTVQAPSTTSLQAPPSVASGFVTAQGVSEDKGISEAAEEAEKQARKKKKEKKLATGPSLMMKKKHMSSMVQKWQKVKKEVEKEDRAKEMRQAAIRKKIEELK